MDNPATTPNSNQPINQNSHYSSTEQKTATQSNDPGVTNLSDDHKHEPKSNGPVKGNKDINVE